MTRRTMLTAAVLAALSGAADMVERARRRWHRGSTYAHCARLRRRSARQGVALCRSLERVMVPPDMRDELHRDLESSRAMAIRDAQQAEYYARLAAEYRRAALRPWRPLPPDHHRKA
jgi:hypothetical protein